MIYRQNQIEKKDVLIGEKCYKLIKNGTIDAQKHSLNEYVQEIDRLKE